MAPVGRITGWDVAYAPHSIGSVLIARAIGEARAHGARTFDFLRGAEPYKYRFGASDAFDETYLVPRSLTGRLLAARGAQRKRRTGHPASPLQ